MVFRIDRLGQLRPAQRREDGSLRAEAYFTRTGVFEYLNADGSIRREYRPPDEVFAPAALASFEAVAVTNDHPPTHLDSTTAKMFAVGMTGDAVSRDGDHVRGTITVLDADTIRAMESGKVEVSCGYKVDVIHTPGISPEGEKYDAIQRNIRGNHVAIVEHGRAGPSARVRLDGADVECGIMIEKVRRTEDLQEHTMAMDEKAIAALSAANEKAANEKVRADAAEAKAVSLSAELTAAQAELVAAKAEAASEKARADKAEAERADAVASEPAKIRARVALETKAAAILGDDFKADASDRDLKVAVVAKLDSFEIAADCSPEAVDLCYRNAVARAEKTGEAFAAVRTAVSGSEKSDASGDAEALATRKMQERTANLWKEAK